mgnify:CR=1 FL=1
MPVTVKSKSKVFISTVLPGSCVLCKGSVSHHNNCLCNLCIANLPWLLNKCPRCSIPFAPNKLCPDCQKTPPVFRRCISAVEYKIGAVDKLIMNIKRNPFCPEIEELSRLLAHTIEQAYQGTCIPSIIIPVPLHWRKLMSRGFNQSSSIARIVASHFSHTKVHENLFIRPKHSSPQHLKTKKQRMLDMRNVFTMHIGHNKVQGDAQLTFSGKSVAIVDDVVTTGATVNALARTLLNSGAKYVDIWSIARTGWHNAS